MAKKRTYDWKTADKETRKLWVRVLREDQHSDEVIGTFFGVSKSTIVGFRHHHMPELTFGKKAIHPRVDPDRFRDLLDLAAMRQLEQGNGNVVAIAPISTSTETDPQLEAEPVPGLSPPTPEPPVPAPLSEPKKPELNLWCQWPMPGRALRVPGICGEAVEAPGDRFCKKHTAAVEKLR